jgi:hypothetical protein
MLAATRGEQRRRWQQRGIWQSALGDARNGAAGGQNRNIAANKRRRGVAAALWRKWRQSGALALSGSGIVMKKRRNRK